MSEEWRAVKGYEGLYQVSNTGSVISIKRNSLRKTFLSTGYRRVELSKNGENKKFFVHRLVALSFIPRRGSFNVVNHLDGNKLNNNVENLEWCSPKGNYSHALTTGLLKRVKLCLADVEDIIEGVSDNFHTKDIANHYNVTDNYILDILRGKTFSEVTGIGVGFKICSTDYQARKSVKGLASPLFKASALQVKEVLRLHESGLSQRKIANIIGLKRGSIVTIIKNKHI